jgi:tetratricopeptide (TPR) repeat protein
MAKLTIEVSFSGIHGTQVSRQSTFVVEATFTGAIQGDFLAGYDDRELAKQIKQEVSALERTKLDDVVGRATLENIAAYLAWRLQKIGIYSVSVSLDKKKTMVFAEEVPYTTYEADLAFKLGVSFLVRGKTEEALVSFTRATELAPTKASAFIARGRCLRKLGRLTEAVADYEHAIALDTQASEAYRNRGNALLELGRYEEAINDLTRAVSLSPTSALTHNNRGYAYQQAGRFEEAIADHDRAIELDPYYEEALRDRAVALTKIGKTALAQRDLALANSLSGTRSKIDIERAKLMSESYQLGITNNRCL